MFHPDGIIYQFQSLVLAGQTSDVAQRNIKMFYSNRIENDDFDHLLAYYSSLRPLVMRRPMLSILEIPFNNFLGAYSAIFLNCLALIVLANFIVYFLEKIKKSNYVIGVVALLFTSMSFLRWAITNCTDLLFLTFLFLGILELIK